jgi:hypothetical protein
MQGPRATFPYLFLWLVSVPLVGRFAGTLIGRIGVTPEDLKSAQNQSNALPFSISPNSIESNVDTKDGSVHNGTVLSLPRN